ncbi:hemolysin-III family protein [Aspergillus ibericus CBS 121593]|uniref:Uncharacterized protein n=1 Tax=Aspergillus ibericus CBS 121593 TaxID=1448316 RepID=A0A395GNZ9_9EURO|nr:hypothetical protein BO80DRAFT_449011 [Aspergillus ibericus CBS 121593]RAK96688.1 hypothetical protein BO80DRAFT_449011 [Aspergillus ibericus CBS 121593]
MSSTLRPRLHIHTFASTPSSSSPPIPIPAHLPPLPSTTTLLSPQLWTTLHPSTLSIYTHLLPAIFLLILTISISIFTPYALTSLPTPAKTMLILNLLAATTTLLLSTTYHLHEHTPPTTAERFLRYDYTGIILLIVANYTTGLYFGFYNDWGLGRRYTLFVSLYQTSHILISISSRTTP